MNTNSPDVDTTGTTPAALPPGLRNRLLAAMQQASDEECECREMEQLLRRLKPAAMPARLAGQLGVQMYVEAQQNKQRRGYWWRGGTAAAAAAVVLCAAGISLLMPGTAVAEADANQGLVSRNIIDARTNGRVEWRRGEAPVRHYEVIYEDAFVLDAEDVTTVIRVPNTTQVEVEEDYL